MLRKFFVIGSVLLIGFVAHFVSSSARSEYDHAPPRIRVGDIVIFDLFGDDGHSSPAIVLKVWEPDEGRNELDLCVFKWNGGTETYTCVAQRSDQYPSAIRGWTSKK